MLLGQWSQFIYTQFSTWGKWDLMQGLLFKKKLKMAGACIYLFWWKKNDISGLIENSDAENTKKTQRKYAVSRMYLKNYDISCLINSFAKSNSLFWYYIKQIMNVFIRAMVRIFSFGERWNVLFNSAIASLNRTFHLSPHENILTIALINIHYLYINASMAEATFLDSLSIWADQARCLSI